MRQPREDILTRYVLLVHVAIFYFNLFVTRKLNMINLNTDKRV